MADEQTDLAGIDFDPLCSARKNGCQHDLVAFVRFQEHHHLSDEGHWWGACQTHLDDAIGGRAHCNRCKRVLSVHFVKYL
jgi:hypothetical protein